MSNNNDLLQDGRKFDFFMIDNDLADREDLNIYEKMTYVVLCRYSNNSSAFPSYPTLCKKTGIGKTKIVETIKSLETKGLIKKVIRFKGDSKEKTSNLYIVLSAKLGSSPHEPQVVHPTNYRSSPDGRNKELIINTNKEEEEKGFFPIIFESIKEESEKDQIFIKEVLSNMYLSHDYSNDFLGMLSPVIIKESLKSYKNDIKKTIKFPHKCLETIIKNAIVASTAPPKLDKPKKQVKKENNIPQANNYDQREDPLGHLNDFDLYDNGWNQTNGN